MGEEPSTNVERPPVRCVRWSGCVIGAACMLALFFLLTAAAGLFIYAERHRCTAQDVKLTQSQFLQKVESGNIAHATIIYDPQSPYIHEIKGRYFEVDENSNRTVAGGQPIEVPFTAKVRLPEDLETKMLYSDVFEVKQPDHRFLGIIYSLFPVLFLLLILTAVVAVVVVAVMLARRR